MVPYSLVPHASSDAGLIVSLSRGAPVRPSILLSQLAAIAIAGWKITSFEREPSVNYYVCFMSDSTAAIAWRIIQISFSFILGDSSGPGLRRGRDSFESVDPEPRP